MSSNWSPKIWIKHWVVHFLLHCSPKMHQTSPIFSKIFWGWHPWTPITREGESPLPRPTPSAHGHHPTFQSFCVCWPVHTISLFQRLFSWRISVSRISPWLHWQGLLPVFHPPTEGADQRNKTHGWVAGRILGFAGRLTDVWIRLYRLSWWF